MIALRALVAVAIATAIFTTAPSAARAEGGDLGINFGDITLSRATPQSIVVCHGFGCRYRTEIAFSAADRARMAQLLASGRSSAAAERNAIAAAVQWFDRRVGPSAGTSRHVARGGLKQMDNPAGQFDCIDSSRNTTNLLMILSELRLLRHHRVEEVEARGALIDGRWPHATAVISEVGTRRKWAIDPWTHAAGERPDVMPLDRWLASR